MLSWPNPSKSIPGAGPDPSAYACLAGETRLAGLDSARLPIQIPVWPNLMCTGWQEGHTIINKTCTNIFLHHYSPACDLTLLAISDESKLPENSSRKLPSTTGPVYNPQ